MSPDLDDLQTYRRMDPSGLHDRIAGLADQVALAWRAAQELPLPDVYADCDNVVVLGMGGSGIGGALIQGLASEIGARASVSVVRGYSVPGFVGGRTLAIASSNSGNTEETVATLEQSIDAGARCVAITTGGRLAVLAREHRVPVLSFEWKAEPRSALGWSFAAPLALCCGLGLLPDVAGDMSGALDAMRSLAAVSSSDVPTSGNPAKQLAERLAGRLPVVVGAQSFAAVAYRWRTQMNENGKTWAVAEEIPEMNHNAPVGYRLPRRVVPLLHVLLLRQAGLHARNRLRLDATEEQMRASGLSVETIDAPGTTALAQMLWAIQLGDFASYYLGLLNGAEPSPVPELAWLKDRLAASR